MWGRVIPETPCPYCEDGYEVPPCVGGCEEIVLTGEEVVALVDVDKKPGTLTATLEDDGFVLAKDPANAWAYDELMKIRHA